MQEQQARVGQGERPREGEEKRKSGLDSTIPNPATRGERRVLMNNVLDNMSRMMTRKFSRALEPVMRRKKRFLATSQLRRQYVT